MHVMLPPSPASARAARAAVSEFMVASGRSELADDVLLIANELVVNAVMHARTELSLSVEPVGSGVRVAVADGSDVLPRWAPSSPMATSGRGLLLLVRLSRAWGVDPLPDGGKRVWAEVDTASTGTDPGSAEDLLELWSAEPWPVGSQAGAGVAIEIDVDVQAMLASRAHTEDLVRELQLTLLGAADAGTAPATDPAVLGLARRLDAANQEFHEARRQILVQTVSAAQRQQTQVRLRLRLQADDVARARRWLEALDEADELTAAGILLLPPFPPEMTAFRRRYIASLIQELSAA